MSYPPSSSSPFGDSLRDKSSANPLNVDMSIFKQGRGAGGAGGGNGPVGQGTTSSDYLQKTKEDNPDPDKDAKPASKVMLSGCKFETPTDKLVVSEPFEMSCQVKGTGAEVPSKLRVVFRLFVSYPDDKGATIKEDLKASWEGFMEAKVDQQTVKVNGRLYRPKAPLGTKLQYQLVAEHPECPDKAESPVVEVLARLNVQSESLGTGHFLIDGVVPLLDVDEKLPEILAKAIGAATAKGPLGDVGTLLVQGHHTEASARDVERSEIRARMIKALLEKDDRAWSTLAVMHGEESEFFQNLSVLAKLGWDCDPVAGRSLAHDGFKREVKSRYGLDVSEPTVGAQSWKALHRSLLEGVQVRLGEDASKPPAWKAPMLNGATQGVFGWGAKAPSGGGPAGRTVDLVLYYGKNPGIVAVPPGSSPTVDRNVLEDASKAIKTPMAAPKGGGKGAVGIEKKARGEFDLTKMVEHAIAKAEKLSQGICATRVREALEAGGGNAKGHPVYAKDYGPLLISNGFEEIPDSDYAPVYGDIAVFLPPTTSSKKAGHIQIFSGEEWVSDFHQGADFWPGSGYRSERVKHWIYRLKSPQSN